MLSTLYPSLATWCCSSDLRRGILGRGNGTSYSVRLEVGIWAGGAPGSPSFPSAGCGLQRRRGWFVLVPGAQPCNLC